MEGLRLLLISLSITVITAIVPSPIQGNIKGFNFAAEDNFAQLFPLIKSWEQLDHFTSARLFTSIKPGTVDEPIDAFAVATEHDIHLLIGLYGSRPGGPKDFQNEVNALEKAIKYDKENKQSKLFNSLVVGIVVGNEDIYRKNNEGTPAEADLGKGDTIANLTTYFKMTRDMLAAQDPPLNQKIPIGHAEVWADWMNDDKGGQLMPLLDFVALNSFPYWEGHKSDEVWPYEGAIRVTENATQFHKNSGEVVPVWATETGWPYKDTSGKPKGDAVASIEDAEKYWQGTGCGTLFGPSATHARKTWWFKMYGIGVGVDKGISWGVSMDGRTPAYNLKCSDTKPTGEESTGTKRSIRTRQEKVDRPARYRGRDLGRR